MEGRTQRLRHHLRRPHPPHQQLDRANGSYTRNRTITDVADAVGDHATVVAERVGEAAHRAYETGEYVLRRTTERISNSGQAWFDSATLAGLVSDAAGLFSTAILGGEVTPINCPSGAVCVGEVDINGFGAQTLGKTILHDAPQTTVKMATHEGRHIDDVEELGGVLLGTAYVVDSTFRGWRGNVFENRAGVADGVGRLRWSSSNLGDAAQR